MTGLEQRCLDRGLPMSRKRRLIIRILSDARDHLSAADLHRRVTAFDPSISLATVYRTLTIFEEAGVLKRIDFGDRTMRYEEADKAPHDHLLDLTNGAVVEFQAPEVSALLARIVGRLGYRLDSYRLDVHATPMADGGFEAMGTAGGPPAAVPAAVAVTVTTAADAALDKPDLPERGLRPLGPGPECRPRPARPYRPGSVRA